MSQTLRWTRGDDLPDPVGRKGMYAGFADGKVIIAGGSNFPRARSQGGRKILHRDIHVLDASTAAATWRLARAQLPEPMSEGASATTPFGVVCAGGLTDGGPTGRVILLRVSEEAGDIHIDALPPLPIPLAHAAAACMGPTLVIAGGDDGSGGTHACFALNVEDARRSSDVTWTTLPRWSGPRRFGAVLQPIVHAGKPALLIAGGKSPEAGYLSDAHVLDWGEKRWHAAASMPFPALQAASIALAPSRVAVLGGSDGHDLANMAALGERYRLPDRIMVYDTAAARWSLQGGMPIGVAGAAVISLPGKAWLLVGGEPSPSLRTPAVFRVEAK